ncbi:cation:proton antiporter [Sulfurifustis variabilis]|uniref:Cation:proton antiporter n=1 Tax=Sulfurifustis variabilis TaxID=1675686 RepID=A0A1B4VEE2_9GAMM|nr:K+/H+ antiporter subunit F [Sulfurifustis variabilis]BAU49017.1 cation:proton antiporter [Sulfurifustis variabilis]
MMKAALAIAFALLAIAALLNLWRALRGPDLTDRIVALDTLYVNAIALLMVDGIYLGTAVYFEAALLIAMTGFVGTVALCKYILRGDIIE